MNTGFLETGSASPAVVTAVREEVGPSYPILYRLGADDNMAGAYPG